jgi:hypothetical protein
MLDSENERRLQPAHIPRAFIKHRRLLPSPQPLVQRVIAGTELAGLLIEHNVGVRSCPVVELKRLYEGFFR